MFTKQKFFCPVCGDIFEHYPLDQPSVCCMECVREWNWLHTLGVRGKAWYRDPNALLGYYDLVLIDRSGGPTDDSL